MHQIRACGLRLFLASLCSGMALAGEPRPARPNVVLMLADDLGWQDLKRYDIDAPSPYETPSIDSLAPKGVLFWQAYSPAPVCTPSRCAIMSGNHPARAQCTSVAGGLPPAPHNNGWRMIEPWFSARMPENEMTLARALKQNGYATGHSGKWHMSMNHFAFPQPLDQGFDFSTHIAGRNNNARGVHERMPNRLQGFATHDPGDLYRLDEDGIPTDPLTVKAIGFMDEHKQDPFFLYYAPWLVHAPIQSRSKELLEKYCRKLGVDYPTNPVGWSLEGQKNPYYCAMVEMLDHYVGQLMAYLEMTDDARWPGHKLIENTYVIFTSDNGGMLGEPGEFFTSNRPLDKGKISSKEGGTRVPLIILGPGIKGGQESDVMVNGLDFYPTILSLVGAEKPKGKSFDGCDLSELLLKDPTDVSLVRGADGKARDTMVWHFPNMALESSIIIGDFKLLRHYGNMDDPKTWGLELFRLYDSEGGKPMRADIEEAKNLAEQMPEKTAQMNERLTEILTEMKASYPYYNPHFKNALPHKEQVPTVESNSHTGDTVEFICKENGAEVVRADLIYTLNGGAKFEEWFRVAATVEPEGKVTAKLPRGTTHYVINLIDENNFLVSYPEMPNDAGQMKTKPSAAALSTTVATAGETK